MPHNVDLIMTLTLGLTAAWVFGFVSQKLRLSPIVGYLIAGVVVGPFTPGIVVHGGLADQLAEIGVILLMFGVGLHFDVKDLLAVRRVAVPGALVQIAVATALAALVAHAFDWPLRAGLVFGLAISVASTVVLLRVLADNNALQTPAGHVAVGWLIVHYLHGPGAGLSRPSPPPAEATVAKVATSFAAALLVKSAPRSSSP